MKIDDGLPERSRRNTKGSLRALGKCHESSRLRYLIPMHSAFFLASGTVDLWQNVSSRSVRAMNGKSASPGRQFRVIEHIYSNCWLHHDTRLALVSSQQGRQDGRSVVRSTYHNPPSQKMCRISLSRQATPAQRARWSGRSPSHTWLMQSVMDPRVETLNGIDLNGKDRSALS